MKRRLEPAAAPSSEDSEESEESSSGESSEYMGAEELQEEFEVNVDLEGSFPTERDYSAIYQQMKEHLGIANFAAGDIAKWFTTESDAGSVVKATETEGEPDALGFTTIMPWGSYKELAAVQQIEKELRSHVPPNRKADLDKVLAAPLGLVLNQRLVNLPTSVAPPLHLAMYDEVAWVLANEPGDKLKFDHILLVGTVMKPAAKSGKRQQSELKEEVMWPREEEELYWNQASLKFEWQVNRGGRESRWTMQGNMREFAAAMVLPVAELPALRKALLELTPDAKEVYQPPEEVPPPKNKRKKQKSDKGKVKKTK
jgi:hypothetical protein